jgi:hypothetical protein
MCCDRSNLGIGVVVAIVFSQTLPEGVPIEMLDAVSDDMGVDTDPPEGLIVHTHSVVDGRVQIMDVWESQAAHDTFEAERLSPAMRKVAERLGFTPPPAPPEATVYDVHRVVRGR